MDIAIVSALLHRLNDADARGLLGLLRSVLKPGDRVVTLDNVYTPGQNPLAKPLISLDLARDVRTPQGYDALAADLFEDVAGCRAERFRPISAEASDRETDNTMERAAYLAATLVLTATGQFVIKARSLSHASTSGGGTTSYLMAMMTDIAVLSGLAAALLASLCWTLAIQKTPLSIAYPFMALSFVIVPFGSAWLFGDRLSLGQMTGSLLIVAGVSVSAFVR